MMLDKAMSPELLEECENQRMDCLEHCKRKEKSSLGGEKINESIEDRIREVKEMYKFSIENSDYPEQYENMLHLFLEMFEWHMKKNNDYGSATSRVLEWME